MRKLLVVMGVAAGAFGCGNATNEELARVREELAATRAEMRAVREAAVVSNASGGTASLGSNDAELVPVVALDAGRKQDAYSCLSQLDIAVGSLELSADITRESLAQGDASCYIKNSINQETIEKFTFLVFAMNLYESPFKGRSEKLAADLNAMSSAIDAGRGCSK